MQTWNICLAVPIMHTSDRRVHTWQNLWAASFAWDCIHTQTLGLSIAVHTPIYTQSVSSEFSGGSLVEFSWNFPAGRSRPRRELAPTRGTVRSSDNASDPRTLNLKGSDMAP